MDKNLPKVYANPINKDIKNNLDYYVSDSNNREMPNTEENIINKINDIFKSPNHVYKSNVRIKLIDHSEIEATIVGKVSNYLLTLNGDKININKIVNIDKI